MTEKELFKRFLAKTSDAPLGLEIERAEGVYLYAPGGKKYFDLISGISVSNAGHRHPDVIKAITSQLEKYMHVMVYGEYVQSPQVHFAEALCALLPEQLNSVYFVNSGAEAIEGAMKLAKRFTGRSELTSFRHAYHGSTQGALSLMGSEEFKNAFRPLLPSTLQLEFNNEKDLERITTKTAAVFAETVQGEAGVILPADDFLKKLRSRCDETGTLLVLDEIQAGMGRTGTFSAFEQYGIVPDILCLAKALGGGLPLGAFVAPQKIMSSLSHDPPLGHITTFGGNPVCCAAGLAALNVISTNGHMKEVKQKEKLFRELLKHPLIKEIRTAGLLIALEFESAEINKKVIASCLSNGVITDWFLFNDRSMRIAPPLITSEAEIREACSLILKSL
jgi:acetylornithine/succinyldiaminopimelate/putrescine aminotransferase